jgi:hypothetical protein
MAAAVERWQGAAPTSSAAAHIGQLGGWFYLSQVGFGLGFGAAFSPLLTLALTHVPPADAADASGLLTTVTQLAQVVGVATFGSLYLSLVATRPSGPATGTIALCEAGSALLAAFFAALLPGGRRGRGLPAEAAFVERADHGQRHGPGQHLGGERPDLVDGHRVDQGEQVVH